MQTVNRVYRSNLDLVATDEILAALLRGLGRLRMELESCRNKQLRARAGAVANTATSSKAGSLVSATGQSPEEAKCWFYASDGAEVQLSAARA